MQLRGIRPSGGHFSQMFPYRVIEFFDATVTADPDEPDVGIVSYSGVTGDVPLVSKFGTIGQGGDDTAVFQRAIDSAGVVKIPPNTTCRASRLYLPTRGGILGYTSSLLVQQTGTVGDFIQLKDNTVTETIIQGFQLEGNASAQTTPNNAIFLSNLSGGVSQSRHRINRMRLRSIKGDGIKIDGQTREMYVSNTSIYFADGYSINNNGSDNFITGIDSGQSGLAGIRAAGQNTVYWGGKLWLAGRLTTLHNPGFLFVLGDQEMFAFNVQQNMGNGIEAFRSGADITNIYANAQCDYNNQALGSFGALNVFRTKDSKFDLRVTDSITNVQPHAFAIGADVSSTNNDYSIQGKAYVAPVSGILTNSRLTMNGVTSGRPPRAVTVGQETIPRGDATVGFAMTSGEMIFTTFTSKKQETINNLIIGVTTAAGATPTISKIALYSIDPTGVTATFVAGTANNTGIFTSLNQRTIPTSAPYVIKYDTLYALGILCVTAASVPSILARDGSAATAWVDALDQLEGFTLTGLADIPSTFAMSTISPLTQPFLGLVTP